MKEASYLVSLSMLGQACFIIGNQGEGVQGH